MKPLVKLLGKFLLGLSVSILVLLLLTSVWLRSTIFSERYYQQVIANSDYLPLVHQSIEASLMAQASYVGVPDEVLFAGIDDDQIHILLRKHVDNVAAVLNGESEILPLTYPSENFLTPLTTYLEQQNQQSEQTTTAEQTTALHEVADQAAAVVVNHSTLVNLTGILKYSFLAQALTLLAAISRHTLLYSALLIFVLTISAFLLRKDLRGWLRVILVGSWLSASLILVPTVVLNAFGLTQRLSISIPYFKFAIDQLLTSANLFMIFWSGLVFVITSLGLITLTVTQSLQPRPIK
jgi:hypothetical protein